MKKKKVKKVVKNTSYGVMKKPEVKSRVSSKQRLMDFFAEGLNLLNTPSNEQELRHGLATMVHKMKEALK